LYPENAEDKKDAPKYAATKIAQPEEDTKKRYNIHRNQTKKEKKPSNDCRNIQKFCRSNKEAQAKAKRCVTCSKMCLKSSV